MNARLKQTFSLLFLAFFLTTKMASLHVLVHSDDEVVDDCAICHVLVTSNETPAVVQEVAQYTSIQLPTNFQEQVIASKEVTLQNRVYSYHLFSRPPPVS